MIEEWRNVVGYEGLYEVSSTGRVKSVQRKANKKYGERTVPECMMKPQKALNGYRKVVLCSKIGKKSHYIHRLVAEAFLPNPNNYTDVNHKDEDKTNNRLENVEWCSRLYNCNYGTRNERVSEKRRKV